MIGVQASLSQKLFDITVRQGKAQAPTYGQENHLRFKLSPLGNRPQTEEARMSMRPAYHGGTAKLQHFGFITPVTPNSVSEAPLFSAPMKPTLSSPRRVISDFFIAWVGFAFGRCERGTSEQLSDAKYRYLPVRSEA